MCGLVGFYPKRNKKVDLSKLYPLWVLNEERGTHSAGIVIGPKRFVGINTKSKARDLIADIHNEISEIDLTNMPVICHTRHATNGAHNESNAHPFRWHRGEVDNFFAFAHNGVIRDLYTFKKTLGMSRHSEALMTIDSQVLGLAMYDAFTNILTEEEILTQYEGNAAFMCYDKNNVFKAWKGANLGTEERPLYYVETKEGWYFCSIPMGLAITFLQQPTLVPHNTLMTFNNYKLVSSVVYERKVAPVFTTATTTSNNNFKQLVSAANSSSPTKGTGFKLLDNAVKLTLKNILGRKSEPEKLVGPTVNKDIILQAYGHDKLKYCTQELVTQLPIDGLQVCSTDPTSAKLLPKIGGAGRVISFQNGVVVQTGKNYRSLQEWFSSLSYKPENTFEDIFNLMYDQILATLVDFIPFYKAGDLVMVAYLNNGKLDYISKEDKISTEMKSIFGLTAKVVPINNVLHVNSF